MCRQKREFDITAELQATYIAMEGSARNTTLAAMNTNVRPQEQTRAVMEDGDLLSLLRACDGIGIANNVYVLCCMQVERYGLWIVH
jgi:hypothetical protein